MSADPMPSALVWGGLKAVVQVRICVADELKMSYRLMLIVPSVPKGLRRLLTR